MAATDLEEAGFKPRNRVYPAEMAAILERSVHTLRQWEANGLLPAAAIPHRDSRGWRYWDPEQVDVLREWIESRRPQPYEKLAKLRSERFVDEDLKKCFCGWEGKDLSRHRRMAGH